MLIQDVQPFKLKLAEPRPISYFNDQELIEASRHANPTMVFDIECYRNYYLAAFMDYVSARIITFEISPEGRFDHNKLHWIIQNFRLIGFNSTNYDMPLLWAALAGLWTSELKTLSDTIILHGFRPTVCEKEFDFKIGFANHIDLFEVAVGKQISLKTYAARMHVPKLQDLPFDPHSDLTQQQAVQLKMYCINDLDCTAYLFAELEPQIKLREQMGLEYELDLRSKSDAQMAEAVIVEEIGNQTGIRWGYKVIKPKQAIPDRCYQAPDDLKFQTDELKKVLWDIESAVFKLNDQGKYDLPFDIKTKIGKTTYQLGIGGLHSCEKSISHYSTDMDLLLDLDVASYYPSIIIKNELYPDHLGSNFLDVYKNIVKRRLKAKASDDSVTNECLKVVINGSFGKFGSKYSRLYSPILLLQVTLTGQLTLLMLIERLELSGISVLSANTDGIVVSCPKAWFKLMMELIRQWEEETGFVLEESCYKSIHSRDVNNYIAIKRDSNEVKTKGIFARIGGSPPSILGKNPTGWICVDAVIKFLTEQIPIEKTIHSCKDISQFLYVRKVKGGAVKGQEYLGRTLRWYYRKNEFGYIQYLSNGNTVPRTQGAYPVIDMPTELPSDIDYDWYIKESQSHLHEIGLLGSRQTQKLLF